MRFSRGLLVAATLACGLFACGGPPAPSLDVVATPSAPSQAQHAETPCEQARKERARVPKLLDEGKLDRALRVIAKANTLCAAEAPATWSAEMATLAEVGRYDDARTLAEALENDARATAETKASARRATDKVTHDDVKLEATDDAKATMRAHFLAASEAEDSGDHAKARDLYLKAWDAWRPNGQALFGAGVAAKAMGDAVGAQRLFDRAVEDLKRGAGAPSMELDIPNGFTYVRAVAWHAEIADWMT
jgi:hypothetical protein